MTDFDYPRFIAIKALEQILDYDKFSNEVLNKILSDPKLTILDRKFITALVYGVLDYLPLLDEIIRGISDRPIEKIDPVILNILRLGIWQIKYADKVPESSAVDESVKLTSAFKKSYASGFVNAILRQVIRNPLQLKKRQEHLKLGFSSEIYGLYKKWFGEETAIAIANSYLIHDPKITVLFLGSASEQEKWIKDLKLMDIIVEQGILLEKAIILSNLTTDIPNLPGFKEGLFYIQDEASMLAMQILQAKRDDLVLDACAGLGGKSFSLLADNENLEIIALEPNSQRYSGLSENIRRLKLSQIKSLETDLQSYVLAEKNSLVKFDQIILDVPCSGLGVIRHKPEIKLNLNYEKILEFPALQMDLLEHAAKLVKYGGGLLYCTCTLNPSENEQLIEDFLNSDTGKKFAALNIGDLLPPLKPQYSEQLKSGISEFGLTIRPDLIPIDGFFICYLRKTTKTI